MVESTNTAGGPCLFGRVEPVKCSIPKYRNREQSRTACLFQELERLKLIKKVIHCMAFTHSTRVILYGEVSVAYKRYCIVFTKWVDLFLGMPSHVAPVPLAPLQAARQASAVYNEL
jgi:hypothetical protein